MVNQPEDTNDGDIEITDEVVMTEDPELTETEAKMTDKMKQLREKNARLNEEKKALQDELQRAKADFLNARKRLEEEKLQDRIRQKKQHIEELLPLCDSFYMAMNDKEAWEKADSAWRKGVEGIHTQLQKILDMYQVAAIDPTGDTFDPHKHEAIGTEKVNDKKLQDTVVSVVQRGYEMRLGEATEIIRPARVTTGILE